MLKNYSEDWLQSKLQKKAQQKSDNREIRYTFQPDAQNPKFLKLHIQAVALKKPATTTDYTPEMLCRYNPPEFIKTNDVALAKMLGGRDNIEALQSLETIDHGKFLARLMKTKRVYYNNKPLKWSETAIDVVSEWETDEQGCQSFYLNDTEDTPLFCLPGSGTLYVLDPVENLLGAAESTIPHPLLHDLLTRPAVKPQQIPTFLGELESLDTKDFTIPKPEGLEVVHEGMVNPIPQLVLSSSIIEPKRHLRFIYNAEKQALAYLSFAYGSRFVPYDPAHQDEEQTVFEDGKVIVRRINREAEERAINALQQHGFDLFSETGFSNIFIAQLPNAIFPDIALEKVNYQDENVPVDAPVDTNLLEENSRDAWIKFQDDVLPVLKQEGWHISIQPDFPHQLVSDDTDWFGELDTEESNGHWFDMSLGIEIDGERLNLLPILLKILQSNENIFEDLEERENLVVPIKDNRLIRLPVDRITPILKMLKNLYNSEGNVSLSRYDAADFIELQQASEALGMRWFGDSKLAQLGKKLQNFEGVQEVPVPDILKGELRHYQQDGLNWLQFLKEYGLAGILADDMGLGKTLQTLAYIATEKAEGRLTKPILVIAPTSLMFNWQNEAAKFCPVLNVLLLHGYNRKKRFRDITKADVVLTTYALLPRDKEELLSHEYHTVILDEAQYIKNSKSKVNAIACQLRSEHRFCLSGTPLENHLGELWSLFNFLMPGVLKSQKEFNSFYRNPIEKGGDEERQRALAQKLKPFMLRRTKDLVAKELPPKTEIIRRCELEKQQRDLYETIRLAMHDKVQSAIASKGFNRSHIVVLEALLKLRQVCCAPALLKDKELAGNIESAKLEQLMDMLTELIEEGRKILLFSQFTEMLKLIELRLQKKNIGYVKLTGQTKDRATPIQEFQDGKVPLFLISLKAGGTGLNLTAADTVIHYDPWWNPATENQATDRAHRIGQDKPVFVYKLVAKDTVEEKILALQERKQAIADGIYNESAKEAGQLTAADIELLFEEA